MPATRNIVSTFRFEISVGVRKCDVNKEHIITKGDTNPGHTERRAKPVVDQAVQSRYLERDSNPPEPRVMGGCS